MSENQSNVNASESQKPTDRDAGGKPNGDIVRPLAVRPPEAARMLGISERHLWSKTKAGEIPHMKLGEAVLYPVAELEAWLAKQCSKATKRNRASG